MRDTVGCLLCLHSVTTHQMARRWEEEIPSVFGYTCARLWHGTGVNGLCVTVVPAETNWQIKKPADHCHRTTNAAKQTDTCIFQKVVLKRNPFLYLSPLRVHVENCNVRNGLNMLRMTPNRTDLVTLLPNQLEGISRRERERNSKKHGSLLLSD